MKLRIVCDSQSALFALNSDQSVHTVSIFESKSWLQKILINVNNVQLLWTPLHVGSEMQDGADKLAKSLLQNALIVSLCRFQKRDG